MPSDFSRILSIGYNGQPAGMPNDGCSGEEGNCGCVHAEANAIVKLSEGGIMLCSVAPCRKCAELILNSRKIHTLIYRKPYRNDEGLKILFNSIRVQQYA